MGEGANGTMSRYTYEREEGELKKGEIGGRGRGAMNAAAVNDDKFGEGAALQM